MTATTTTISNTDDNADNLADKKSPGPIGKLIGFLFSGWVIRYTVAALLTAAVLIPVLDNFNGALLKDRYDALAKQISTSENLEHPTKAQILSSFSKYGLAWFYVISAKGALEEATAAYAPEKIRNKATTSDFVDIDGAEYYDAVAKTPHGETLHLGFHLGALKVTQNLSEASLARTVPIAYGVLLFIGTMVVIGIIEAMLITSPLERIARASRHLIAAEDQDVSGALSVGLVAPAVSLLANNLRKAREDYNKNSYTRVKVEHELRKKVQDLERERDRVTAEFKDHQFTTNRNFSELASKEAEDEFLNAMTKDLYRTDSVSDICQTILDRLSNKYPRSLKAGVFVILDKQNRLTIPAFLGFDEGSLQSLKTVDFSNVTEIIFSRRNQLVLSNKNFQQYGLGTVPLFQNVESLAFLPIIFEQHKLGFIILPTNEAATSLHEKTRVLKNVCELAARSLHRVATLKEELESARTDPLTGLYNKKFLYELTPQLKDRAGVMPEDHPVSVLMVDGDHFKDINDTYGHVVGDQVLKKMADLIRSNTRMREGFVGSGRYKDYVIRYGGEEVLVVLENTNTEGAKVVADRIKRAIEEEQNWPSGIVGFSVSIGVASCPEDTRDIDDVLKKADASLYYVKQELGRGNICCWIEVPTSFRTKMSASTIGGELGVFDPPGLLQSISSTQKTGVLTVKSMDDRQFWILFDTGKPLQARLGKYRGINAIIEFVGTFTDGNFQFQERSNSGTGRLPRLNDSFNLNKSLERMLMEAVLSVDNMITAKKILPSSDIILIPKKIEEIAANLDALERSPDAPSKAEMDLIRQMIDFANEVTTLGQLFEMLDETPTTQFWHCAGLMVTANLVDIKQPDEEKWLGKLGAHRTS